MSDSFVQLEQRKRKLWRMEREVAAVEKAAARNGDLGGGLERVSSNGWRGIRHMPSVNRKKSRDVGVTRRCAQSPAPAGHTPPIDYLT
jgi:hypothetical protein